MTTPSMKLAGAGVADLRCQQPHRMFAWARLTHSASQLPTNGKQQSGC